TAGSSTDSSSSTTRTKGSRASRLCSAMFMINASRANTANALATPTPIGISQRLGCSLVMAYLVRSVADALVTAKARHLGRARVDRVDQRVVAAAAALLGDPHVHRGDLKGVVEATGGERDRVIPAIDGLDRVLGDQRVGGVAVVADRDRVVRAALPVVEVVVHHVTVGAGGRI